MDVNVDVNSDVNDAEQRPTPCAVDDVSVGQYTPYKNGGIPDGIEDKGMADIQNMSSGDGEHLNSGDNYPREVDAAHNEVTSEAYNEESSSQVVVEPQLEEEPEPVHEEPIESVQSDRKHAPPPPARSRTGSSSSSSSSSSSDSEKKGTREVKEQDLTPLPEVVEDTIYSVDRKDIEKGEKESSVPPPLEEVGRTVERSECSEVTASKEITESGDRTEIKVIERKVTSLEEVEELVKEYPVDENGAEPGPVTVGLDEEVIFTKEVHLVEDFTSVHTEKEVSSGGIVQKEITVEERLVKEETEVGDSGTGEASRPVEGDGAEEGGKKEELPEASSSDQEPEEVGDDKSSPSTKTKKEKFFEFFKRKPPKEKPEEQEVKDVEQPKEEEEEAKEEESAKSEGKQTPEKKKRHFLIFKKPDNKERIQKEQEEEPQKSVVEEKKEENEDDKEQEEDEKKSLEGEEPEKDKSEKKRKYHFFHFKKSEPKDHQEKEDQQEGAEKAEKEQEQAEGSADSKSGDEDKEKVSIEKKKYHFVLFKKSEPKESETKTKSEDNSEDKLEETKEESSEENNKPEDTENKNTSEKKKYHFFPFRRSEPKEAEKKDKEDSENKEEDKKGETKPGDTEENKTEDAENKNTIEKKRFHLFQFRRSEPKDNEAKTKSEDSGEELEEQAKEQDADDSKSEDTDNKNTLERKKKRHFFNFHRSEQKDSSEVKSPIEEEQQSEGKEEDKDPSTPNKNTLERKRRGFFYFKKSEAKESEEQPQEEGDEHQEEGSSKQTPEKKKLALFKVFPTGKDKKERKERVTVEQKEDADESPADDTSPRMMEAVSADETERREIFKTTERPKSFVMSDDGPTPVVLSPTHADSTAASAQRRLTGNRPSPQPSTSQLVAPLLHSPGDLDAAVARPPSESGTGRTTEGVAHGPGHFVVVAIDFGTTFSGYAFSFTRDPDSIHMMRKWEGGDPGVINQKTPTCLLLHPDGKFHSFGFTARDFFHDLDPQESKKWLYFDKFKMTLHYNAELNKDTMIKASNGKLMPALSIFTHALRFFKEHALQELSDQSSTKILNEDVRWVITVPAIWKAAAKQFMRQAAYHAGIGAPEYPDQLLIALEPEAASIYVRRLRMHQLVPERHAYKTLSPRKEGTPEPMNMDKVCDEMRNAFSFSTAPASPGGHSGGDGGGGSGSPMQLPSSPSSPLPSPNIYPTSPTSEPVVIPLKGIEVVGSEVNVPGTRYIVVDCGGGTVDITVHEMESKYGNLHELYKATGGPYGSVGVDIEFEKLLVDIFGSDFMEAFKYKRPAGFVDLMIAFESRKRAATPYKNNALNVSLPFSFIDYHKKFRNSQVESAIRKYGDKEIRWSSQGMLRLSPEAMRRLFQPTLDRIKQAVGDVLNNPAVRDIRYMFLVGGFSESQILQHELRREFGHLLRIIIPQDVSLTILKGAVCFGMDPTVVKLRKSRMTYGVGVLNRFVPGKHPREKLVHKDGVDWCTDVFDKFVVTDQSVALGDTTLRSYTPAKAGQKTSIINIYCSERSDCEFITDRSVERVGSLCLDLSHVQYGQTLPRRREIQTRMIFGDTEIKVTALDVATGKCVRAAIDFLSK